MAGSQKATTAAPKKCTKSCIVVHPISYLFRKQEKETNKAADRALQVGIKSGQDRNSGSVVCRKANTWELKALYSYHLFGLYNGR